MSVCVRKLGVQWYHGREEIFRFGAVAAEKGGCDAARRILMPGLQTVRAQNTGDVGASRDSVRGGRDEGTRRKKFGEPVRGMPQSSASGASDGREAPPVDAKKMKPLP